MKSARYTLGLVLFVVVAVFALVHHRTPPPLQAQETFAPGVHERSFEYDGLTRTFRLYIPAGYDGTVAFPLVVGLHGGGGNADHFARGTEMDTAADKYGVIVVYPEGTGEVATWNAAHCCGGAYLKNVDDVGFIRALINTLDMSLTLDHNRIYAAGMSNGGMLTHRLGAEATDLFAGIGVVAGTIGGQALQRGEVKTIAEPGGPLAVMIIHGMQDENVHYEGGRTNVPPGSLRSDLSVADSAAFWVARNNCDLVPETMITDAGMVITDTYACNVPGSAVTVISIVDGTHDWPGSSRAFDFLPQSTQYISATETLFEFFLAHPRSG